MLAAGTEEDPGRRKKKSVERFEENLPPDTRFSNCQNHTDFIMPSADVCCSSSHGVHGVLVPGAIPPYVLVARQIGQHASSQLHSNGAFSSRLAVVLSHSMVDWRICRHIPKECFERVRILFRRNGDCRYLCHCIGSRDCCSPPISRSGYRILMRKLTNKLASHEAPPTFRAQEKRFIGSMVRFLRPVPAAIG